MNLNNLREDIDRFLTEDIGLGDITSESIFNIQNHGIATFIAKEDFITAGIEFVVAEVFHRVNPEIHCQANIDGEKTTTGKTIFKARGPVIDLLRGERVALNLAQRLSGIATLTNRFVEEVHALPVKIVDTRKTTPGLRALEKYAVRVGGGHNHRFNLTDGVLIKDNHIAACGSINQAVSQVRNRAPHTLKIEVETENLTQVKECLAAGVEIIMLDNMSPEMMTEAVKIVGKRALMEASGGITLANVREVAATGVDLISIGALTHSAPACDISMNLETES